MHNLPICEILYNLDFIDFQTYKKYKGQVCYTHISEYYIVILIFVKENVATCEINITPKNPD
jgi:hypothetical protein